MDPDPRPPASAQLELEVALLTAVDHPAPSVHPMRDAAPAHSVLVAVAECDMRGYVRQCLEGRADIRVHEVAPDESLVDAAHRVAPRLLIAEHAMLGDRDVSTLQIPLLLIGDGAPPGEGQRIAVLQEPFNARRLVDLVGRLLGRGPMT